METILALFIALSMNINDGVNLPKKDKEPQKTEQSKTKDYTEKKQVNKTDEVLEFEGLEVTEANIDDFISDNNIEIGRASTAQGKLSKVKNWIKEQNN